MEQSFADLLSDAFSETSVPSFPDGDLDFENINFEEKFEEDKTGISHESLPTKEEEALHRGATAQTAVLSGTEATDIYMVENVDKEQSDEEEDFQGVGFMSVKKTPKEEDYTSSDGDSEQEGSVSGDDEECEEEDRTGEKPGDLLMSVHCSDDFCDGKKEDKIFAEGQPMAPEGAHNPLVRNKEQGVSELDEEVSYFKRVPERGGEMMIKSDGMGEDEQEREEEKQENSSDSECEGMKVEQGENVLTEHFEQVVENPCGDGPTKASLDPPEISVQSLQDLNAEVENEDYVDKIKDFSGDEHQEAGESFADYPSDFSSCEYIEDGGKNKENNPQSIAKQDTCVVRTLTDVGWMEKVEDTEEVGDEYLYSIDLEVDADRFRNLDVATRKNDRQKIEMVEHMVSNAAETGCDDGGETGESDSYSSTDDEIQVKSSDEELLENMCLQDLEIQKQLEELQGSARQSTSEDSNGEVPADFNITWNLDVSTSDTLLSEDLLTTEDTNKAETLPSYVTLRPAKDVNSYSVVQKGDAKTTSPSNHGSLDDSFFFSTELEACSISELGQWGDDEWEDERNREQEQERIKAFYEFYDDSDTENGREGRQIKVQFCADPLSQVIHYETDSSDQDSLSSSTNSEEDQSSSETSEELKEPDNPMQMTPTCDPLNTQLPENMQDLYNIQSCTMKHKCLSMLKLTLKMCVVIVMGLLMFWLATDQAGWLSQLSFF